MITNELMLDLTAEMPCKQIDINGKPYLQRHYAGRTLDGKDVWVHRFLTGDGDRHVHSHPFNCRTTVVRGSYLEELEDGELVARLEDDQLTEREIISDLQNVRFLRSSQLDFPTNSRVISTDLWHRIAEIQPETWSILLVDHGRAEFWHFRDESGMTPVKSSPRNWWQDYRARGYNVGDAA